MSNLDFKHEVFTSDNKSESSFEAYRNEDPFSFSFDVRITTVTAILELFHLTHNQMTTNYRKWLTEHKCSLDPYKKD